MGYSAVKLQLALVEESDYVGATIELDALVFGNLPEATLDPILRGISQQSVALDAQDAAHLLNPVLVPGNDFLSVNGHGQASRVTIMERDVRSVLDLNFRFHSKPYSQQ